VQRLHGEVTPHHRIALPAVSEQWAFSALTDEHRHAPSNLLLIKDDSQMSRSRDSGAKLGLRTGVSKNRFAGSQINADKRR